LAFEKLLKTICIVVLTPETVINKYERSRSERLLTDHEKSSSTATASIQDGVSSGQVLENLVFANLFLCCVVSNFDLLPTSPGSTQRRQ
jgi:hypothetical protein